MNEPKIEDELNKSIKNIKNLLEDIKKDGETFKKTFECILSIGKDFMETINNILKDKLFDNIKPIYKNFSELVSSLHKLIGEIKRKKDNIQTIISEYENFRDNKNYNEIFNQNKDDEKIHINGYSDYLKEEDKKFYEPNNKIKSKENIRPVEVKVINLDYYYYSISFCCNTLFNNDFDFDSLIKQLKISYSSNKICLSMINKNIYVNDIIKSNKFEDDKTLSKYIHEYPILFEIDEIKSFKDFLINQCKIKKEELDYRGNAIYFNLSHNNKRGQEKYDPPHGCICLGLKRIRKYENDDWLNNKSESSKWAIAYHGIGNLANFINIKAMIFNIINYGLKPGNSQDKMGKKDKRHPQGTIGEGVYLNPKFKDAEENAGTIYIKQKKYKIILMVRVLIEKISEPEDAEQWILPKDYIRSYRILAKKIE
jgi:hypothetical protein